MTFRRSVVRVLAWYLFAIAVLFGPTIVHVLTAESELGKLPVKVKLAPEQRILYVRETVLGTVNVDIHPYRSETGMLRGRGTGGIFTKDGYILTAAHVVEDTEYVTVTFHQLDGMAIGFDELRREPADVLAVSHKRDMAIIKLRYPERVNLTVLPVDADDKTPKGSKFWFIGCTSGIQPGIVTNPDTKALTGDERGTDTMRHIVMADTVADHGDSGGPVLDADGNIIAIVIASNGTGSDVVLSPLRNGFAELLVEAQAKAKQLKLE